MYSGRLSSPHGAPRSSSASPQHTALLVIGVYGYIVACLLLRWMSAPLFAVDVWSSQQWQKPTLVESAYLVYMCCSPVALWVVTLNLLTVRFPRLFGPPLVAVLVFSALVVTELDLIWYATAKRHVNFQEVIFLLTDRSEGYWGLGPAAIAFHLRRVVKHAAAVGLLYWFAGRLVRRPWFPTIPRLATARLIAIVLALSTIDALVVGYARSDGNVQWTAVSEQNPFRLTSIDRVAEGIFTSRDDNLGAANQALSQLRQTTRPLERGPQGRAISDTPYAGFKHVLLITIESFSPRYVDDATMPFWSQFAKRATLLTNHYSTGNNSEHGILGLVFGAAPYFFQGRPFPTVVKTPVMGSPYIDVFNAHGYQTKSIAAELGEWDEAGKYFVNFTRPSFRAIKRRYEAPQQDWDLVPILLRELRGEQRQFVHLHYWSTHLSYAHSAKYNAFQPEVPDDFVYTSDMREHLPEIVNRYKNCLRELDDWLQAIVTNVDLDSTIVILTGDHGEEFFEHGRFLHANALDEPQIRTPFLMYIPGRPGTVHDEITSHADVMPTLMDVLGWANTVPEFGQSVFTGTHARSALVSSKNHPFAPDTWAVVTQELKTAVDGRPGSPLKIVGLFDRSDSQVRFRRDSPDWDRHLREILRYESLLSESFSD